MCEWYLTKRRLKMTPRQRISLSTWEKWRRFHRIPWKFLLNLLLVVATTTLIVVESEDNAPYARANIQSWEQLLAPSEDDGFTGASLTYGYRNVYYLYKISTFMGTLGNIKSTYFDIHNTSLDAFQYTDERAVELVVERYVGDVFNLDVPFEDVSVRDTYALRSVDDMGPFHFNTTRELSDFIHSLKSVSASFVLRNFELTEDHRTCFEWTVTAYFDCGVRGRIAMHVDTSQRFCPSMSKIPWYRRERATLLYVAIATIVFALLYQFLILRAIARAFRIIKGVKEAAIQRKAHKSASKRMVDLASSDSALCEDLLPRGSEDSDLADDDDDDDEFNWSELSCAQKMKFFNMWFFIGTAGNLCNIVGPALRIHSIVGLSVARYVLYFTGLGCLLAWVNLMQYFEETTSYYVLITTLKNGAPRVVRFLLGVLPVFLGYALFGVAFFSSTDDRFSTVDMACVTLFSLLNGDVIHDVFDELYPSHPVVSRIYLYTFISLFIYAVLNIFIAIIEDAFFASKAFQLQQQKNRKKLVAEADPLRWLDIVPQPAASPVQAADVLEMANTPEAPRAKAGGWDAAVDEARAQGSGDSGGGGGADRGGGDSAHAAAFQILLSSEPLGASGSGASANAAQKSSGGSAGAEVATAKGSPSAEVVRLVAELRSLHGAFVEELARGLQELLDSNDADVSTWRTRPPHDSSYYPCGYSDCVYCVLRGLHVAALQRVRTDVNAVVKQFDGASD